MHMSKNVLFGVLGLLMLLAAVAALTAYLYLTLVDLRQAQTTIVDQEDVIADVALSNIRLRATLEEANSEIVKGNVQIERLDVEVQKGNETIAYLNGEIEEGNATIEHLGKVNLEWESEHRALDAENRDLQTTHEGLRRDHNALQFEYVVLERQAGDLEALMRQADALRQEISELEAIREPLVLESDGTRRGWFTCTGSMEPVITCLDEATWLYDFEPEDIVVGATISFNPSCKEDAPDDTGTAHRVMQIEVRDGVHYYWPKGDANRNDDGCWVPEHHVQGYIVEVHRDMRPANATLRAAVNLAKSERDRISDLLDQAEEHLDQTDAAAEEARLDYRAVIARFCGANVEPQNCSLPDYEYNQAISAYNVYQQARLVYDQAYSSYKEAFAAYKTAYAHWECWDRNAKESEYPGHIPYSC